MAIHESPSNPLNPEGHVVNMEGAERALAEANEIEESSDPQVVQDVLEQLQSAHEALETLVPSLGKEVGVMVSALDYEIGRLHRILPTHH